MTGTEPSGGNTGQSFKGRCHKYPAAEGGDDRWYTFWGRGLRNNDQDGASKEKAEDQKLYRLEIPADPVTGTWTWSTVTPTAEDGTGGLTAAVEADWENGGGIHYTRFFYVPALRCFAWIPRHDSNVELIKP